MAAPMTYAEFKALPQPPAPHTIAYGADPLQHVELWTPAGDGPFPVVLMIHGGCWQTSQATAGVMHAVAADLVKRGMAVWNIEYRGIDVPGGGYPGTFADVAAAADLLAARGPALGLEVDHVIAVGHSAGGHLALWLAGRSRIAAPSVLRSSTPLAFAGVISLGGLPDLAAGVTDYVEGCGAGTIERLVGPPGPGRADVYADTSPVALAPLGLPQIQINGALDPVAPPRFAERYARKVRARGDCPRAEVIMDTGHFELITPGTRAWCSAVAAIERLPRP